MLGDCGTAFADPISLYPQGGEGTGENPHISTRSFQRTNQASYLLMQWPGESRDA